MKQEREYSKVEVAWLNMLVKRFQGRGLRPKELQQEFDEAFSRQFLREQFGLQRIIFKEEESKTILSVGLDDRSNNFDLEI